MSVAPDAWPGLLIYIGPATVGALVATWYGAYRWRQRHPRDAPPRSTEGNGTGKE